MNTTIAIIIIVVVVLLGYAYYNFHRKHSHHFSDEKVEQAIEAVFADAGKDELSSSAFINNFKHKLNSSHKEALALIGKAQKMGLLQTDGQKIKKV